MKGIRFREPIFGQLRNLRPSRAVFLTASPERSLPKFGDEEAECGQRLIVGRHGMIVEVALDDLSQPFPLDRDRLVPALPQLLLDGLQLRPHAVAPGFPLAEELAPTRLATDKSEAQEVEGLRLAEPAPLAVRRRMAAELDQAGLVRWKRQCDLSYRSRMASRKRRASASCSKPTMMS